MNLVSMTERFGYLDQKQSSSSRTDCGSCFPPGWVTLHPNNLFQGEIFEPNFRKYNEKNS